MPSPRRDFVKGLLSASVIPGVMGSGAASRALEVFLDRDTAQNINPDFDPQTYDFWSGFLSSNAEPIVSSSAQTRGEGLTKERAIQPLYLHHGPNGFKNAAELDADKLIPDGDVTVSMNTSAIKMSAEDQITIEKLQNAQVRVDIIQKSPMLSKLDPMSYTIASGAVTAPSERKASPNASVGGSPKAASSSTVSLSGSVQPVSAPEEPTWKKMQNIILPGGEGRWALNLQAQKMNSIFFKIFQYGNKKEPGKFAPMIGLPGVSITALQSFNILYGAIHSQPVSIMKSNPLRIYATQQALQLTGAPGAVTGILLQTGTCILMPAGQAPAMSDFKGLTVVEGRIVPLRTPVKDLDAAAAETLKAVTYVSFGIEVKPVKILADESGPGVR